MLTTANSVTIVSRDRDLLRRLAWTVDEFGYLRTATDDWSPAALWRRCYEPELWLLDTRDPEALDTIAAAASARQLHVVALAARDARAQHEKLLQSGADDVVCLPVDDGELAARLRAGVRHLEFKQRFAARAARDPVTGLLTRSGLTWWAMSASSGGGARKTGLLVVFQIGGVDRIKTGLGADVALGLRKAFASALKAVAEENAKGVAAQLDEDVFAISLPGATAEEGAALAAKAIGEFRASQAVTRSLSAPPVVSAVVGDWSSSWSPSTVLTSLVEAVEHAPLCSEQAVVPVETVNAARAEWTGATPRRPALHDALAGQVAESLPVVLRVGESVGAATAWGVLPAGALPPVVPVVDDDGKLIGLFDQRYKDDLQTQPLGAEMVLPADATVAHDTPARDVSALLEGRGHGGLVVVKDERPVGFVTGDSLGGLLAPRHGAASYRVRERRGQIVGLVVPSGKASAAPAVAG
ncbi:CBS domain-containing protein [Botrimarina sp.]|uniref:CBS domain-containing protein n=1 Tax=Botrimarina sp. TaxID=2795802 RepID=UPI0032F05BF4